jgi:hypothetical protein
MVGKYDDPQEAAMAIVAESYRLWLQHESRTDDITAIIIQIQVRTALALNVSSTEVTLVIW